MRLPYVPSDIAPSSPEDAAIVQRIQARRHPRPLQPLDLTLLHSPGFADGWNSFLGAVRTRTSLRADVREVAVSRIAVLNKAWYEWAHHAPLAVAAGVAEEVMRGVVAREGVLEEPTWKDTEGDGDEESEGLSRRLWAVLRYTDEMTRDVSVRDETFAELRRWYSDREVVEITGTVSFKLAIIWTSSGQHFIDCQPDRGLQLCEPIPGCSRR